MSWLIFLFFRKIILFYFILVVHRHFLFAKPAFPVLGWVRETSALHSLQVLLINSGPPDPGSAMPVPRPGSACYLSFESMRWSSWHTFFLQFSAWLGFASKILFWNDDVNDIIYIFIYIYVYIYVFPYASVQHFSPVVHSSPACGQVSKESHLHMVLPDNPLSTIFSSHSVAFLPVATFLSLHQLAQWFIQQASSLEVMVHN